MNNIGRGGGWREGGSWGWRWGRGAWKTREKTTYYSDLEVGWGDKNGSAELRGNKWRDKVPNKRRQGNFLLEKAGWNGRRQVEARWGRRRPHDSPLPQWNEMHQMLSCQVLWTCLLLLCPLSSAASEKDSSLLSNSLLSLCLYLPLLLLCFYQMYIFSLLLSSAPLPFEVDSSLLSFFFLLFSYAVSTRLKGKKWTHPPKKCSLNKSLNTNTISHTRNWNKLPLCIKSTTIKKRSNYGLLCLS